MAKKTDRCTCPADSQLVFLGHLKDCPEVSPKYGTPWKESEAFMAAYNDDTDEARRMLEHMSPDEQRKLWVAAHALRRLIEQEGSFWG